MSESQQSEPISAQEVKEPDAPSQIDVGHFLALGYPLLFIVLDDLSIYLPLAA